MIYDWEVQAALYRCLSVYAPLTDIATVYDVGPSVDDASAIYPYVAIGALMLGDFDTDTSTGFDATVRIHSWSNTGSTRQVRTMQSHIYNRLHRQPFLISGAFRDVLVYRENAQVMQDSTGALHGVCEYRAILDLV
jgi:hypothetical protein